MTNRPPGFRCRAALRKHSTCSSWVRRLAMLFQTRYTQGRLVDLAPQLRHHRLREFDSGDRHAAGNQRDADPAGTDGELKRRTRPGQARQKVDSEVDHVQNRQTTALKELAARAGRCATWCRRVVVVPFCPGQRVAVLRGGRSWVKLGCRGCGYPVSRE